MWRRIIPIQLPIRTVRKSPVRRNPMVVVVMPNRLSTSGIQLVTKQKDPLSKPQKVIGDGGTRYVMAKAKVAKGEAPPIRSMPSRLRPTEGATAFERYVSDC